MTTYKIKLSGKEYEVAVVDRGHGAQVTVEGHTFEVSPVATHTPTQVATEAVAAPTPQSPTPPPAPSLAAAKAGAGSGSIHAPIPGVVTTLCVKVGDRVEAGDVVLKLEAMKMENDISTPVAGVVREIAIAAGAEVKDGQLLAVVG